MSFVAARSGVGIAPPRARAAADERVRRWGIATMGLMTGYLLMGRSFAYLGIPRASIFIGEFFLAAFFLFCPRESWARWFDALVHRTELSGLAWSFYVFLLYGTFELSRGLLLGYDTTTAIQNIVFNVYPLYIFLGLWLARRDPTILKRFILILAWVNVAYTLLWYGLLDRLVLLFPGTSDVPLFSHSSAQFTVLIGLLAFYPDIRRVWFPFLMSGLALLALQSRASWVGFLIALPLWALLTRRVGRLVLASGALALLMIAAFVLDLKITTPTLGPSEVSARNVIGAAIAPFDKSLAERYTADAGQFAGTAAWRRAWWSGIWNSVNADTDRMFFGYGYGYFLKQAAPDLRTGDADLRTPHNVFFYALGYGGWLGVVVFGVVLGVLVRLLLVVFRRTGQAFGLAFLFGSLAIAFFGPFFETPFAAIPCWIIIGMAAAPALGAFEQRSEDPVEPVDAGRR